MKDLCYALYRCRFSSFVDFAFRELHPGQRMKDNWHIRLMADFLQYPWINRDPEMPRKLIFNLPPGYLKTHICSVAFPAWVLGRDPRRSVLIVSETADMALEIREQCLELMQSERYQFFFPRLRIDRIGKEVAFTYGGKIRHAGIECSLPRRKSDVVILDNPQSLRSLDRFNPRALADIANTLRDPQSGMMVLGTRRLGEDDLSGFFQRQGWFPVRLPVVALDEMEVPGIYSGNYVRRQGELLHPDIESEEDIKRRILELGGDPFAWQYMQGIYRAQISGQRTFHVSGRETTVIGTFDPTTVVLEDLGKWMARYRETLSV